MSKKILYWVTCLVLYGIVLARFWPPVRAADQEMQCSDIRKIDFQNIRIDVGDTGLDFQNGVASSFDELEPKILEWEATFRENITIDVAPDIPVRFALIHNNHVGGSGWRFYLVGYRCFQGKMKRVFKQEGLSLAIDRIDAHAVVVTLHTVPGSPTTKYFSYVWNAKTSKYELNSTWLK